MASIILRKGALVCQVIYRYIGHHAVTQPQQQQCVWLLAQSVLHNLGNPVVLFFLFYFIIFPGNIPKSRLVHLSVVS